MFSFATNGTPFERGKQQGEACRELTPRWVDHTLRKLADRVQASSVSEAVRSVQPDIDRWRHQMESVYPEGDEECCGIASGLQMDEKTYFTAIFGHRLLSCTVLGFRDQRGYPIMGKTDDILKHEIGLNVLETTRPDKFYRHVHFHFAGSIWTVAGMNECGLAMAMTGLPGPLLEEDGLFSLVALHNILPVCANVEEAIEHIRTLPVNCYGFSLLFGDVDGRLSLIEKSGAGMVVLPEQQGGFFLHTNHILDAGFARRNPAQSEPVRTNGQRRYRNALQLLRSMERSEEWMAMFLSNRSPTGAICQQGEDGLYSDFRVMFVPPAKRIVFWSGYPASMESETLELSRIF